MNINFLRIPLFDMLHIDNVNEFKGLNKEDIESFKSGYEESEFEGIVESIRWAKQNPDYDFLALMPKLKKSNEDIYIYLCKLESSLKDT